MKSWWVNSLLLRGDPSAIGEASEEYLSELGYSEEERAALKVSGVIGTP